FRSGGFNGGTVPPYEPENLRSYEIGVKLNSSDHRIRAELAVVRSDYDDYQIVGVDPANIVWGTITTNAGDVRINGIDGMVAFKPVNGLQIGLSASYLDTKFVKVQVIDSTHWVGDNLDLVPEYSASLFGEYQFAWPGGAGAEGTARVDFNQQGRTTYRLRYIDPDPSRYYSESGVISLLNAQLGWSRDGWWAELYGRNLLNEEEFDSPFSIEDGATRPWPRTFGVQVGYRFN
ncbi:TonB-dependent receptor domain-containing protein, partial [Steroidobacter sp.]|uniref:TonB-dependent receptor domain-containing protein n=1 Tax=Steroidobacter sp. TaxID=1978227 RepID=UPI001A3C1111